MARTNFAIINKFTKSAVFQGTYAECQEHFNSQDKIYRKTHMIKLLDTYKVRNNESNNS